MANIVSATFTDRDDAERALNGLRERGVSEDAITIVGRGEDGGMGGEGTKDKGDEATSGALTGAGVGAAVGALFGLAAFAIPGVGPFIAAGALANVLGAAGGAAVSGALVGATAGGLAGALARMGLGEEEAGYYAGEIERGNVYLGVDLDRANVDRNTVMDAFRRHNGRAMGDTGTMTGDTMAGTMPGSPGIGTTGTGTTGMTGTGTTGMTSDAAGYTGTGMGTPRGVRDDTAMMEDDEDDTTRMDTTGTSGTTQYDRRTP